MGYLRLDDALEANVELEYDEMYTLKVLRHKVTVVEKEGRPPLFIIPPFPGSKEKDDVIVDADLVHKLLIVGATYGIRKLPGLCEDCTEAEKKALKEKWAGKIAVEQYDEIYKMETECATVTVLEKKGENSLLIIPPFAGANYKSDLIIDTQMMWFLFELADAFITRKKKAEGVKKDGGVFYES